MRESQIERKFRELENKISELNQNSEEPRAAELEDLVEEARAAAEEEREELEDELRSEISQAKQTLKMQLGKVRSRVQDLEEERQNDTE